MSGKLLHENGQGTQACRTTESNRDYERSLYSNHICLQNTGKNIRWEDFVRIRGPRNE